MGETSSKTVTATENIIIDAVTVMEIVPVWEGVYDLTTFVIDGQTHSVDEIELPATIILDADSNPDLEKCDANARLLVAFLYERERVYDAWLAEHDTWLSEHPEEAVEHKKWVCAHPDWIIEHFDWLSGQPDWVSFCADWEASGNPTKPKKTRASSKKVADLAEVPTALLKPVLPKGELAINDETDKPVKLLFKEADQTADITLDKNGFRIQGGDMLAKIEASPIDLRPAYMLYSIIAKAIVPRLETGLSYNDTVNFGVTVSVKDLGDIMFATHKGKGYTREEIESIIRRIAQYDNVIGILDSKSDPRIKSKYPVLQWRGYSSKTNTIAFGSPFFSVIARQLYIEAGKLDQHGMPRIPASHKKIPMFKINSALIKSSILAQRNRRACDIVSIICNLIENSSNTKNPTISAYGILEKMPEFWGFLSTASSVARSKAIKSSFEKAFELLRTHTYLQHVYPGIELPSPGDYPKWSALRTTRYYFSHEGIDEGTYELVLKGDFEKIAPKA